MSEGTAGWEEVTGHVSDLSWLDDEAVPASWLHDPGQDPGQYSEPAAADFGPPAGDAEPPEPPWWLSDEFCGTPEEEHAAWLAGLPAGIRADYLDGPYTGAGEAFGPGFTHHDGGGPSGAGFAAGGALDTAAPGWPLAQALADATQPGCRELNDSEQIGVLCGWQRQAAWAQAGLAAARPVTRHTTRAAGPAGSCPGPCQPRLVRNSAIATYWHAAAAQTQAWKTSW